jgi:hypothetical protein
LANWLKAGSEETLRAITDIFLWFPGARALDDLGELLSWLHDKLKAVSYLKLRAVAQPDGNFVRQALGEQMRSLLVANLADEAKRA